MLFSHLVLLYIGCMGTEKGKVEVQGSSEGYGHRDGGQRWYWVLSTNPTAW